MKTLFPKLWVKNALLAFLFLLSVSATIILINLFELSYDKENFFYKSYEKKSSLNDNHIPAETGISSENTLPPGCDYSKSAIDLTKYYLTEITPAASFIIDISLFCNEALLSK